jgi:hypothetical protein
VVCNEVGGIHGMRISYLVIVCVTIGMVFIPPPLPSIWHGDRGRKIERASRVNTTEKKI